MIGATTENCGSQLFRLIHQLVFLLCCSCVVPSATQDGKIRCSVPSVYPYQDTVLMCHFPEDVLVSKKDFTVYHYPSNGPEAVLDCWWVRGHLDCYTKLGVKYDKTVGRNLNLTFSEVTKEREGIYACQLAGYGSSSFETCELNLKIGENNTCNISQEQSDSQASLTCFFNEDIHKTQRNFIVYKHNGQEKTSVVNCSWDKGLQRCQTEGYQYNMQVSSYLTMTIPKPEQAETLTYSCWHNGSQAARVKTCSIVGPTVPAEERNYTTVILVLVIVSVLLTLFAVIVCFILYKRRRRNRRRSRDDSKMYLMCKGKHKSRKVTENFNTFLLEKSLEMYPNMVDGCYFVPPVYFNKVRYTTQSVVDQVVYIPDLPHDSDVRQDRAMKHVLHCLHHMAEQGQENMFVLTQFNYNDYLNNPGQEYKNHHLPVLDGLKNKNKDKHIGCFDVLIIHRQHGVVIGVVKSLSDKDDCSQEGEQKTDVMLAKDISEGIERLKKAVRVIKYLISDQQHPPPVRLTLMFPNVTRSTLQRALDNHTDVAQNLRKCMKTIEPPTGLCLCADDLSNALRFWDVDPTVMGHLTNWWGRLLKRHVDDPAMSDELYQTMIARFCGVATSYGSEILHGSSINQLPKTQDQSVCVTGDLFERLTLYPGMVQSLDRPRMLLTGPPATGKSRMLALVGRKWISEGHSVYIINTSTDGGAATTQLEMLLQQTPLQQNKSAKDMVISLFGIIDDDEKIDTTIKTLIADASSRKIPIFAVLDELGNDLAKSRQSTAFLQKLLQLPDLHLWAATCCSDMFPDGCDGKNLTETLSCPPSVVREAQKYVIPGVLLYTDSNRLAPTDGLPVKHFYHQGQGHQQKEPRDCNVCGEAVVQFLKTCVYDEDAYVIAKKENPTTHQAACTEHPTVLWKDILILVENKLTENMALIKCLLESGIPVQIMNYENQEKILTSNNNTVLAAKAGFLCGLKRKVVVYVEGSINKSDGSTKWTRVRGITSCTSQLVVIRMS